MNLRFLGQGEMIQEQQGIFWYLFKINNSPSSPDIFLNEFLNSNNFSEDCMPFNIKRCPNRTHLFLKKAFNSSVLSIADFRLMNKHGLLQFFDEYSKEKSWGDDKIDFITLLNKFSELIKQEKSEHFFLISKEWFDKHDKILNDDNEIYIYYFLIIWLDTDKQRVNVCEWNYD